jgi:hypothetical protein
MNYQYEKIDDLSPREIEILTVFQMKVNNAIEVFALLRSNHQGGPVVISPDGKALLDPTRPVIVAPPAAMPHMAPGRQPQPEPPQAPPTQPPTL